MAEKDTTMTKHVPRLFKVGGEQRFTHVFKHADTGDLIKAAQLSQVSIITDLYMTALRQPSLLDALLCKLSLPLTESDPVRFYSIVLCCIENQRTPTTTDIQQALTRTQTQLAANIIELTFLGSVKVIIRSSKVGAGIGHALAQPEGKELAGAVVVKGDGLSITLS